MRKKFLSIALLLCITASLLTAPAFAASPDTGSAAQVSASGSETPQSETAAPQSETEAPQTESETPHTENETEKPAPVKKKKKGNCDSFIGLDSRYWVLATAKKKTYVYKKKSKRSKVLGHFTRNNCIVVDTSSMKKGKKYTWLKVKLARGKRGYILKKNVNLGTLDTKTFGITGRSKKDKQRIKICRYGLPYIGTKFVLGGSSLKNGIDCSTFARKALRHAGIKVSSHALAVNLSRCGKKISRSKLKPGDLLFYYNSYKDKSIGHCAVYIGNGYIINASGHQGNYYPSGGIRFSRIDYRKPTAVRFRNLVGN